MTATQATILTTAQVAEEYRISRRTISRLITDFGLEPAQKLPGATGAYLFNRTDVDAAIARKSAEQVAEVSPSTSRARSVF